MNNKNITYQKLTLLLKFMTRNKIIYILIFLLIFIFFRMYISQSHTEKDTKYSKIASNSNDYVGDGACVKCHNKEFNDWRKSDHYMSMLPANESNVKGDFNNVNYVGDGVKSKFFRKSGKFYINTEGEDGKNHDFEVKFTFGVYPLQQYLIQFPDGKLQVTRLSWDSKKNKWFNQYPGQKIASHDWLHWTQNSQNWNTMCAVCHSTNLKKNYNIHTDSYKTSYSKINVSCESCHGAGEQHINLMKSEEYLKGDKREFKNYKILNNKNQKEQINSCAPCHALITEISPNHIKSKELMDNYIPQIPDKQNFHEDGQVNNEDYNYASFLQSKMYSKGVKCSDCHNPHTSKLKRVGNLTCTQCHSPYKYDTEKHTFHKNNTPGSKCISCHMPGKIYMGNDLRHDHFFRVPRPDLSLKYGTPNACSQCHQEKSSEYLTKTIVKWYGKKRKYHFSEDLIPGSKLDKNSEEHLIKIINNEEVPDIIQATAASYLGLILSKNSLKVLLECTHHKDAQVRYRAVRSLANFPKDSWINEIGPLLSDPIRAVRIAAADLFIMLPAQQRPVKFNSSFISANKELKNYLTYQSDFSVGNIMLGDYYLKIKNYKNAEFFYLRGLKKDDKMNYALLNLSTVYNALGQNNEAILTLNKAINNDPKNDRIYYNLALIYNEIGDKKEAERNFRLAVNLNTKNPRVYYNYGLILFQSNKHKSAVDILIKGIKNAPNSPEIYYALTYIYIQTNKIYDAKQSALILKKLDPTNPNYQNIFITLGLD